MSAPPLVGIVGGIGPESTIDYYRGIITGYTNRRNDGTAPPIVITSLDVTRGIAFLTNGQLPELVAYLLDEVRRLERAGATFAVLAANSPHVVFDELAAQSPLPLLSIVDAVAAAAARGNATRLGLFGTGFTMKAEFYPVALERRGLTLVRPRPDEMTLIHERYIGELLQNQFLPATRDTLLGIVGRMRDEDGIDGLILGGTELPILLRDATVPGVELIDSTVAHVDAIVDRLLA